MKPLKLLVLSFCLIPGLSFASQVEENFASRATMQSATAVWNHGTGFVTPHLEVKNWEINTGVIEAPVALDLGDGSLGAFNSSTWSQFAVSVDAAAKIIYVSTDLYPVFKFTSFNLPLGWTLEPVGSNPLIIRVLGDMILDGKIECSGKNGTNASGNGVGADPGLGGEGRCGGGRGGNGGAVWTGSAVAAQNGTSPDPNISGGIGATTTALGAGSGGGGGGSWASHLGFPAGSNSSASTDGNGTAGTRGIAFGDPDWTFVFGAAGGGGGSGSDNEAGGGGGAGGGVIILHVGGDLTIGASGEVLAIGGNGAVAPGEGGGGGAGGGGSIQIFVGGTLKMLGANASRPINADAGIRGVTSDASAGDGGSAWRGRVWTAAGIYDSVAGAIAYPQSGLWIEGDVRYVLGSFEAVSKSFDSESSLTEFTAAAFLPVSGAVQMDIAGSNDAFVSDDSGWVSVSNISQINDKRYFRFRVVLNNSDDTNPARVDKVTIDYTTSERKEFNFKTSGCGTMGAPPVGPMGPGNPMNGAFALVLSALPFLYILWLRRRAAFKITAK